MNGGAHDTSDPQFWRGQANRTKEKNRREKEPVQDSFRPVETDAVAMTWQLGETK